MSTPPQGKGREGAGRGIRLGPTPQRLTDTSDQALAARLKATGKLGLRIVLALRVTETGGYSALEGMSFPLQVTTMGGLQRVKEAVRGAIEALEG